MKTSETYKRPELRMLGNIVEVTFSTALWTCSGLGGDDDDDNGGGHGDD